jgi:hypothetical protein
MEALNKQKSRRIIKSIIALSMTALLFTSCGKDTENEIVANDTNTVTNPVIIGVGTGANDFWNTLKSQNACPQGSSRMADMPFNMQGSAYGAQIAGSLQPGNSSGTINQTYTGMNQGTKDLLFIAQVNNGNQISYNVVVSLCRWNNGYVEYIGDNAGLSNFGIQYMSLSNSSNCPTGEIMDGWLTFSSQTYGGSIPTRFSTISSSCY